MNGFVEIILSIANFMWGYPMLILLVGGGIILTVGLGGIQFVKLPYILKNTIGKSFGKKTSTDGISSFQALTSALATTLGSGNIIGVAFAIAYGGPGAIFWMWVIGLIASILKFSSITLAIKYRKKNEKGEYVGGPMYYLSEGTPFKWTGTLYALALIPTLALASSVQVSSLSDTLLTLNIPKNVSVIVMTVVIALIVYGGITRIVKVTEKLIPFMSVLYMAGCVLVVIFNISELPVVIGSIFKGAFAGTSAAGGFGGATLAMVIRWGISRGVYSSDAGNGTSSVAHSNSDVNHPIEQAIWGIFEVFFDTIVVCSCTAFAILTSGVWKTTTAENAGGMTALAFENTLGVFGNYIVSVSLFLFAISTVIVFIYYGEKMAEYLFGKIGAQVTRLSYCALLFIGSVVSLGVLLQFLDFLALVIIILNVTGIFIMFKEIRELTKDFFNNKKLKESEKEQVSI